MEFSPIFVATSVLSSWTLDVTTLMKRILAMIINVLVETPVPARVTHQIAVYRNASTDNISVRSLVTEAMLDNDAT